jgi:hypothetical protein
MSRDMLVVGLVLVGLGAVLWLMPLLVQVLNPKISAVIMFVCWGAGAILVLGALVALQGPSRPRRWRPTLQRPSRGMLPLAPRP